jgi:hypothetical protein
MLAQSPSIQTKQAVRRVPRKRTLKRAIAPGCVSRLGASGIGFAARSGGFRLGSHGLRDTRDGFGVGLPDGMAADVGGNYPRRSL